MKKQLLIVGAGTTAKQMYYNFKERTDYKILGFAVDKEYINNTRIFDLDVFPLEDIEQYCDLDKTDFFIAIGWNRLNKNRADLYFRLKQRGFTFATYIAPTAILQSEVLVGENCWIADGAIIESFVKIGDNSFIKSSALIAHNCIIGNNCWIGAKSLIAGKTEIKNDSFIGIGAIIFDCIIIAEHNIIGAGCTVKKSTPKNFLTFSPVSEGKTYSDNDILNKLIAK